MPLVEANFNTPGRGGGEIDLVMLAPDGTLFFVEVCPRSRASHRGAGGSITRGKQHRIIFAAWHYLMCSPTYRRAALKYCWYKDRRKSNYRMVDIGL